MDSLTGASRRGDTWALSQMSDAMDICSSDEEYEVVATPSSSSTQKDHKQMSSIDIDSHDFDAKACDLQHASSPTPAPTAGTIHNVAATVIAQGLSPSWQPGPCRSPRAPLCTPSHLDSPPCTASVMHLPEQQPDKLLLSTSWLFKGIKATIGALPLGEIAHSHDAISSRKRIGVIAEYTWIQITKGQQKANVLFPAVYSPGQPRVWQGIATPSPALKASSEPAAIIDEHPQRQQAFPWEPTFKILQSLHEQQSSTPSSHAMTNFRHVDIVSDAATLATLFKFVEDPDPLKSTALRLQLATVQNTLFITTATHRGRGYTDKGGRGPIPAWVAPALTTLGTGGHATGPLFLSGNHFRIVRYRLGSLVLVVRTKVDFALENHAPLPRNEDPPFRGCKYEYYRATDDDGKEQVLGFQTLIKQGQGRGTQPGAAGVTSVRFASWDCVNMLSAKMPLLWFGRTPFILDGVVSRDFKVTKTKLYCARESYAVWEKQHQTGLRLLAGALKQLQGLTRAAGGNCIVIADPGERSFHLHRPVIERFPLPESLALAVWGPDGHPAETEYESSTESDEESALSQLSGTPSGFSDWKLEEDKMPKFPNTTSLRERRRAVDNWLDDDESAIDPFSDEDYEDYRDSPVNKKQVRVLARSPVTWHKQPIAPRSAERPARSVMDAMYDGTADYNADDEDDADDEEETESDEEADVATIVGDNDNGQPCGKGDTDDESEQVVEENSRSDSATMVEHSSPVASQYVPLSEEDEDYDIVEDFVEDVDDEDYGPSTESDELSL